MDKIYTMYADELKNALLSDNINRIIIYGDDGRKIEYTRSSSIDFENLPSAQLKCLNGRSYGGAKGLDPTQYIEIVPSVQTKNEIRE